MAEGTGSTPYVLRMPITTSTAPSKPKLKHEWIVIIPDYEGALEKRMSVRPYASLSYAEELLSFLLRADPFPCCIGCLQKRKRSSRMIETGIEQADNHDVALI